MASIDLYEDFNEELDARAGDDDDNEQDGSNNDVDGDKSKDKETVDAKIKIVRVKRKIPTLNVERLKGNRGIAAIDDFFKDVKFKGKGYEKQDLNNVMKRLEHWAHR
jgi:TIMELESS-interacting protein